MASSEADQQTIETVHRFLESKLRPQLLQARKNRCLIQHRIDQYLQTQSFLALVEERRLTELDTMIDLGSQFFVKAFIPDLSKICLDIGFGFHAPLTSSEALDFLSEKLKLLTAQLERYSRLETSVQEHINAIENELMKWRAMSEVEEAQKSGRLI